MDVILTPELEQFVADQVAAGLFRSPSDVVQQALRVFEQQEQLHARRLDDLRQKIAVGIEQADRGDIVDGDTVFERLEAKARAALENRA